MASISPTRWVAARPRQVPRGKTPATGSMAGKGQHPVPPGLMRTPAQVRGNKLSCLLAEQNHGKHFTVYKPNVGRQSQLETFDSLRRKFRRV